MKRILTLIAILPVFNSSVFAQSFLEDITLSLDKGKEAVYAKGDTIRLFAETMAEKSSVLKVYENGCLSQTLTCTIPAGKSEIFTISYNRPVALMLRLSNPAHPTDSTTVGAIVSPEEFEPGFEDPADFDTFWKKQLRALRKIKMRPILTPVEVPGKDGEKFLCYNLEINCIDGAPVRGYLALPKESAKRSLPIVIFAHGAGNLRESWTQSSVKKAVSLAKKGSGAIALDINAHGMLNGMTVDYYVNLQQELKGYYNREVLSHEDFYFRTMFLRMVRALDYLCSRKEWDGKRVLVTGGSQGGAQSTALAGLDSRVTMMVVDVPAMWDVGGALKGRSSGWPKQLEKQGLNSSAVDILPYYDGSNMLRRYHGGLVVNVGLIDMTCPPAAVWSAFNVCPSPSKEIHPNAWKGHSAKYSLPAEMRNETKQEANAILDNAINAYLQ